MKFRPDVLIFDSGVGARAVDAALRAESPHLHTLVIEDNEGFPYGNRTEADIHERVVRAVEEAVAEHNPDSVLLACNTACVCGVVQTLKSSLSIPVHATLPPLAEASRLTCTHNVALLATPATIANPTTARQIALYRDMGLKVTPVPCQNLAAMAQAYVLEGKMPDTAELRALLDPIRMNQRIDTIVLACTHYTHLKPLLEKAAFRPFYWVDSSTVAARRFLDAEADSDGGLVRRA